MREDARQTPPAEVLSSILDVFDELRDLKGLDAILDRILLETRRLARADAGSIFLVAENRLVFSHVHNDSLFSSDDVNQHAYLNATLPMDDSSIAGYVACRGLPLACEDAYAVDQGQTCRFNASFDAKTGYKTRSMFTVPVVNSRRKVVAVMQIINAMDHEGRVIPFSSDVQAYISLLADHAASVIEAGIMTNEMVLRMIKMAELRDPAETGAHVQRVGAYAAEIFHVLARKQGLNNQEIKRRKDLIRVASMLHDVGKVGVSDRVLKKPGKLTNEEFEAIKRHTLYGARLFSDSRSEMDVLARDIALHHHQRWDGRGGYPGKVGDLFKNCFAANLPLAGEDIPLAARITALADVFDALVSPRSYKEPWPLDQAVNLIRKERGRQFDPEVVDAFASILNVIEAIRHKFS